jgi:hypothetical protein
LLDAKNIGVTLIPIPFWWDFQTNSLISTVSYTIYNHNLRMITYKILKYRPDTNLPSSSVPEIPLDIPANIVKREEKNPWKDADKIKKI